MNTIDKILDELETPEGKEKMEEDLKEKYNQIVLERQKIIDRINVLEENEIVKEYFELRSQNNKLSGQQNDLYKQIKVREYSSCKHIWVHILHDYDRWEGRSYNYHGCVKCGLDNRVLYLMESYDSLDWLTFDQRIMYDFIRSNYPYNSGIKTDLSCDFDLAKAIYTKIKEVHPDIDDETAVKYLKVALRNIRNIKVSAARKESRAKRLSLKPEFNKWTGFGDIK